MAFPEENIKKVVRKLKNFLKASFILNTNLSEINKTLNKYSKKLLKANKNLNKIKIQQFLQKAQWKTTENTKNSISTTSPTPKTRISQQKVTITDHLFDYELFKNCGWTLKYLIIYLKKTCFRIIPARFLKTCCF